MKEFFRTFVNAYLNRNNEKAEIFLKDDNYPSHNKLIEKINEENKLKRMLGVSNQHFQQLIIWGINSDKLPKNIGRLKYFDRYIKTNEDGDLHLDKIDIKYAAFLPVFFIIASAISLKIAQDMMSEGLYVYFSISLMLAAVMLFALVAVALIPTKKEAEEMKQLLQKYNDRNKENN